MQSRKNIEKPEDLNHEDLARFVLDMIHRIVVHYTMWFSSVEHQFGMDKALEIMRIANEDSYKIQMDRLSKTLGFKMTKGIPQALLDMSDKSLLELTTALGVNWLADDGVWFQAVEGQRDMYDAKRCNDTTWTRFSPFEAWSIKKFLNLPLHAGLEGLKRALRFRMYARINIQTIIQENPTTVIFQMNNCRVQAARQKRGLDDYPCKSAGLVEYRHFAESIDSRIKTECIGCPPDKHPPEWHCAWKFTLEE
jgi:hypothetical protein